MNRGFLKGAFAAATGALALVGGTALAGNAVGDVFNLGVDNTVDNATTRLTGNHTSALVELSNTNNASADANGVLGRSASSTAAAVAGSNSAGGVGVKGNTTGSGSGVNGRSVHGAGVRAFSTSGNGVFATSGGSSPTVRAQNTSTGPAASFETDAATAPFSVTSSQKVTNLNADQLDGKDASSFLGATDKAADSDKLDGKDSSAFLTAPTPWSAYAFVDNPASTGGKVCTNLNLPAGGSFLLKTVMLDTYSDASAVAYVRYFIREGPSVSRIATQRIVTTAVGTDPVTNTRSGVFNLNVHIKGGSVFDVQNGDIHSLAACIQSSSGASASGQFHFDGDQE